MRPAIAGKSCAASVKTSILNGGVQSENKTISSRDVVAIYKYYALRNKKYINGKCR